MKKSFGNLATISLVLSVPLGIFAGMLAEYALKSNNARNIDITAEIAYLTEITYIGVGVMIILLLASLVLALLGLKKDADTTAAKTTLVLMAITVFLVAATAGIKSMTEKVETSYSDSAFNEFLKNLKQ